jgi:hypothetical protein
VAAGGEGQERDVRRPAALELPSEATVLDSLQSGHPRLLALDEDIGRLRRSIQNDPVPAGYYDALITRADELLGLPVSQRVLVGPRLLTVSRTVLDRVYILALAYRLSGGTAYRERATRELLAAATFEDWNPGHFLDVAEMMHAFAVGYDWLHGSFADDERRIVRSALVRKGLEPARDAYEHGEWWTKDPYNWNSVCNGAIIVAALSVADEEPEFARFLLPRAIANLPIVLGTYAPDGAWPEGPGYFAYSTRYLVTALAALESALGTDFGLGAVPGLASAGRYRIAVVGPSGQFFNYADNAPVAGAEPSLFWLARRYDEPAFAYTERRYAGRSGTYRDLLFYDERGTAQDLGELAGSRRFAGAEIGALGSRVVDGEATWLAFKGGDNGANHSHLDLGTFVLDALGQRWAAELGPDDYDLPSYFGAERYTYYRLATEGQNTLVIGGLNQERWATAPIETFSTSQGSDIGIVNLTSGYAPASAVDVRRGFALLPDAQRAIVRDEVRLAVPLEIVWSMHTEASPSVVGTSITLSRGGQRLDVVLLEPDGLSLSAEPVMLASPQRPTNGVSKLLVRSEPSALSATITVLFVPDGATAETVRVRPLAEWGEHGPVH